MMADLKFNLDQYFSGDSIRSGGKTRRSQDPYSFISGYGEREIDLGVRNWVLATNKSKKDVKDNDSFQETTQFAIDHCRAPQNIEIHIEPVAYNRAIQSNFQPGTNDGVGFYFRGNPKIPAAILTQARHYQHLRERGVQVAERFLIGVYNQVVKKAKGQYRQGFEDTDKNTLHVLGYFALKLRRLGRTVEAERLEDKLKEKFKVLQDKDTYIPLENQINEIFEISPVGEVPNNSQGSYIPKIPKYQKIN